jgi:mRNA interferase RelE/StbE
VNREVRWTERALKDAEKLDPRMRERVLDALDRLAETGHGDVKKLVDRGEMLRLRVGDWRVIFLLSHAGAAIEVLRVLPRGQAYRG